MLGRGFGQVHHRKKCRQQVGHASCASGTRTVYLAVANGVAVYDRCSSCSIPERENDESLCITVSRCACSTRVYEESGCSWTDTCRHTSSHDHIVRRHCLRN